MFDHLARYIGDLDTDIRAWTISFNESTRFSIDAFELSTIKLKAGGISLLFECHRNQALRILGRHIVRRICASTLPF